MQTFKRELKRYKLRYGRYLEPILVFLLIFTVALPVATVINLTPRMKPSLFKPNVLGVQSDEQSLTIEEIGGAHSIIVGEILERKSDNLYSYSALIRARELTSYSKPIVRISNPLPESHSVTFAIKEADHSSTEIGILVDNTNYILKTANNMEYFHSVQVESGEQKLVYLDVKGPKTNFTENVAITMSVSSR